MARVIDEAIKARVARDGQDLFVEFAEVWTEADKSDVLRVANDIVDHVSNGNTYIGFPFELALLSDDGNLPTAKFALQNIDRRIGEYFFTTKKEIQFKLGGAFADEPDTWNYSVDGLVLRSVSISLQSVSGTIVTKVNSQEVFPWPRANPQLFPGLGL